MRITRARQNPHAALRLFCFPYAGGSASVFRSWPESLPSFVDLCCVDFPGRGALITQPPFTRMSSLIDALAGLLVRYLDLPFAFFGHSMGALVSFEAAREFRRRQSLQPEALFVASRRAPHLPERMPPLHDLPESEFIPELQRLAGTPEDVLNDRELIAIFLPTIRADFAVCETYTYSPEDPLACRIVAFGGLQDQETTVAETEAWGEQTRGEFRVQMLPGGHFFPHTAKRLLLRALEEELNVVLRGVRDRFRGPETQS